MGIQQAPGFCAQKSSNCWAFEPAGGVAVALPLVVVSGEVVPPLESPVVPVPVSELDVPLPVSVLDELSDELLSVLSELELLLSEFAAAASVGAGLDSGIATSAGGPGTCGAPVSLPPQPAATTAITAMIRKAARRGAPIFLTPP
jgi:hypothetical protein